MKQYTWNRLSFVVIMSMLILLFPIPIHAETDDGYYEIDYEVLNADNDSVSVANDYFDKPGILIVDGDDKKLQLSINHSQWVVGLKAPVDDDFEDVEILDEDDSDEDDEKRIVQFELPENQTLEDPVDMKMHIVVDVLEEDYDHEYTARFDFSEESMEEVDAPLYEAEEVEDEAEEAEMEATDEEVADESNQAEEEEVENAGINSGTMIVIVLLVGIAIILIYSFGFKKKK